MRSAFDDLLYLTSRDLYVAILKVLPYISRLINRVQKEKDDSAQIHVLYWNRRNKRKSEIIYNRDVNYLTNNKSQEKYEVTGGKMMN